MKRFIIPLFTFTFAFALLSASAVTATKEYVDRQDGAMLQAAKDYTDQHGGGGVKVETDPVWSAEKGGYQPRIDDLAEIRAGAALGATALQEHQSLEPATNYTDTATNALDTVLRAEIAAHAPANYAAVSNAAMNARSITNLIVYGEVGYGTDCVWRGAGDDTSERFAELLNNSNVKLHWNEIIESLMPDPEVIWFDYAVSTMTAAPNIGTKETDVEAEISWIDDFGGGITVIARRNTKPAPTSDYLAKLSDIKHHIDATDPTFSNAVLAVGLNIDTNSVAVLNEIAATFGDFPIGGTATTVGGLLVALAAAAAWLKKNKADKSELPYHANVTATLKDRAFNSLTFDGTEYNLSTALAAVTPTASGQPRDLLIVATATASTTISFTAGTIKGDKPTIDGVGTWLITLTEYASGVWYCRQIKMEDAA